MDLAQKVQFVSIEHKTFNTKFPAQAIRSPNHLRYKPVPKTEVPETIMDHSSIVRDSAKCSAYNLADHFILLNFRLNELFVESKNARIEVRTRKLWQSKVVAADSQG